MVSLWLRRLSILRTGGMTAIALALVTGCTAPPPSAHVAPGTSAVAPAVPRSPGNAALAFRTALLFRQMCVETDHAGAREIARRLGFRRVEATEGSGPVRSEAEERWIYDGYDAYLLTLQSGPSRGCILGVHLVEPDQAEPAFRRMVEGLAGPGLTVGQPRRGATSMRALGYAIDGPGARRRVLLLGNSGVPASRLRSIMSASDSSP
jgi:hypothetical protein